MFYPETFLTIVLDDIKQIKFIPPSRTVNFGQELILHKRLKRVLADNHSQFSWFPKGAFKVYTITTTDHPFLTGVCSGSAVEPQWSLSVTNQKVKGHFQDAVIVGLLIKAFICLCSEDAVSWRTLNSDPNIRTS